MCRLVLFMAGLPWSQTLKNRGASCILLLRIAFWTILKARESFHTGIPAIFEEWAMPMVSCILSLPEAFPSALLVFFFFSLVLVTLLILILVFSQEMRRNQPLIPDMPDLFFGDIASFFFLGPIAGTSLLPCMLT
jgi:hypothetical protein